MTHTYPYVLCRDLTPGLGLHLGLWAAAPEVGAVVSTAQLLSVSNQKPFVCPSSVTFQSATGIPEGSHAFSQTIPPSSLIAVAAFCVDPVALVVHVCLKPGTTFKLQG